MQLAIKATEPQKTFLTLAQPNRLFCAGYGAGKSEAMANAALIDACQSPTALVACYAPTYDLVRLITAIRLEEKLLHFGVPYKYNKQENVIYTSAPGWGDIILRTMDNPSRIIGYEAYTSHLDELDTLPTDKAAEVWRKSKARNRQKPAGLREPRNQMSVYTTPEGFRFAYQRWVLNKTEDYVMVRAPSYSNPYLPADYVQELRDTYPPALVQAYIEGEFVNLTTGTVYSSYDRAAHRSTETIQAKEPLFIGQDFNVGKMASTVYVKRNNGWHAVDQLTGVYDTPALIETLKEKYHEHHVTLYPDASGDSRKTVKASVSDISLLRQAGFTVRAPKKNPRVKDRINAVNTAFSNGNLWVNDVKCPDVANGLEQQAFDKNGEPDKSNDVDHQNDATGYPIAFEMPVKRPVMFTGIQSAM